MNINIAILEDNSTHFNRLSKFIESWASKHGHTICIKWFHTGADIISSDFITNCNLLFSDIELHDTSADPSTYDVSSNGINICSQLRKNGFHSDIIFLTAFREYVFDGYQVQAINYLLKPVSAETVENCMNQYLDMHNSDFYYLHKNNNIIQIPYNEIVSISRIGHDCCISTMETIYTERTSLKNFENHLPKQFIRCHKSCIVNLNFILSLSGSTIKLANNQKQVVGRIYLDNIKKSLLKIATNNHI